MIAFYHLHIFQMEKKMKKIEEKEKAEALLWYKRKMAVTEDINIEDISDEQIEDVEILTEK